MILGDVTCFASHSEGCSNEANITLSTYSDVITKSTCAIRCRANLDCAGFLYSYKSGSSGPSSKCQLLSEGCITGSSDTSLGSGPEGDSFSSFYPISQCFDDKGVRCDNDPYPKEYCEGSSPAKMRCKIIMVCDRNGKQYVSLDGSNFSKNGGTNQKGIVRIGKGLQNC